MFEGVVVNVKEKEEEGRTESERVSSNLISSTFHRPKSTDDGPFDSRSFSFAGYGLRGT